MKGWNCVLGALAVMALAYFAQLPTPLRLNTDGVCYLSMAASFNDGHGFTWHGHRSQFPIGYPAIVAMLERLHLGSSAGLVEWNYLMLVLGVAAGIWLLKRWLGLSETIAALAALLFMLARGTVRYATIPGSEMTYIALSFLCLACLFAAEKGREPSGRAWVLWLIGAMLSVAIFVRVIGVVLLPAAAWSLGAMLVRRSRVRELAVLIAIGAAGAVLVGFRLTQSEYVHQSLSVMNSQGWGNQLLFALKQRCCEMTEVLWNIPIGKGASPLMAAIGVPSLLLVVILLLRRWRTISCIDVYLIGYVCVLMVWPYKADVRFWLPVQMLVYGLVLKEIVTLWEHAPVRAVAVVWIAAFIGFGVLGLYRSTRITYSGSKFSEVYDLEFFRDSYRAASHNGLPVDPQKVNPDLVQMLQRFGKPQFSEP